MPKLIVACECDDYCDHHVSYSGHGCSWGADYETCSKPATGEDRLCDECRENQ